MNVNSKKQKGKKLRHWTMTDIIPRGFQSKIHELTTKHLVDVEDLTRRVEAIQFESEEQQQQHADEILRLTEDHRDAEQHMMNEIQDLVQNRHVPRHGLYDTVLVVVEKNMSEEEGKSGQHPYYMICCKKIHLPR